MTFRKSRRVHFQRQHTVCRIIFLMAALMFGLRFPSPASADELFPQAYGILAKEKYIFPVDLGDWPVKIDSRRQLFVDDFLLKSKTHIEREFHQFKKHPKNPLYTAPKQPGLIYLVLRDEDGKFRMWYEARMFYIDKDGNRRRRPTVYIESDDGLNWRAPKLGVVVADGNTDNNYVFEKGLEGMFYEPWEKDPSRRFKGLAHMEPGNDENQPEPMEAYWLYVSPDGIRWRRDREYPVIKSLNGYRLPQSGIGDTSSFRWDPVLKKYICNAKFVLPGKYRCYGICESDDLIHWTPPRMLFHYDELDPPGMQIYAHTTSNYESIWLGFVKTMEVVKTEWGTRKHCEMQLSFSRDGRHFTRPTHRRPCIPVPSYARRAGSDYPCMATGVPLKVDNELWFYYGDTRHHEERITPETLSRIGLLTLRIDGFASLNAGDEPGEVVTRPLTFSGKSLFVNADVQPGGWVKAAVLTADGSPLAGYEAEHSSAVTTDTIHGGVTWANQSALPSTPQGHTRFRFALKNARLYSFWVE